MDRILDKTEAAAYLGRVISTFDRYRKKPGFPKPVRKPLGWLQSDLDRWRIVGGFYEMSVDDWLSDPRGQYRRMQEYCRAPLIAFIKAELAQAKAARFDDLVSYRNTAARTYLCLQAWVATVEHIDREVERLWGRVDDAHRIELEDLAVEVRLQYQDVLEPTPQETPLTMHDMDEVAKMFRHQLKLAV